MQNKHIEHPEDSILTGDLSALDCLRNEGNLSVKMDGAPAIVWGTNPATGNFFVGTKSVFNKVSVLTIFHKLKASFRGTSLVSVALMNTHRTQSPISSITL